MKRWIIWSNLLLITLTIACSADFSNEKNDNRFATPRKLVKEIPYNGEKELNLEIEFSAGNFIITRNAGPSLVNAKCRYDSPDTEPVIRYDRHNGIGTLVIETKSKHIDRKGVHINDSEDNQWIIEISAKAIVEIDAEIGFAGAELDFTQIPLKKLTLEIGAGIIETMFDQLNPERCEIEISCGAAKFEGRNLGNANFESFSFDGGVGTSYLEFTGLQEGEADISLNFGVASNHIIVADRFDVKVCKNGSFLAPMKMRHFEERDGYHFSPEYGKNSARLDMDINLGIGHTSLKIKKTGDRI